MRLLLLMGLAGLGFYLFRQGKREHPDERIRRELRASLPEGVRATVADGLVTLRGTCARDVRDDLLVAALAVPGVVEVSNLLEIEPRRNLEYAP
jgi:hypothetical protein